MGGELGRVELSCSRGRHRLVAADSLTLHQLGVDDAESIKLVNLFSDPTEVYSKSRERMSKQFDYSVGEGEDTEEVTVAGNGNQTGNVVAV